MITVRRDRIAWLAIFLIVITVLSWKTDFLGTSETLIEYEPPLRPPGAAKDDRVIVTPVTPQITPEPPQITSAANTDTDLTPSKPSEPSDKDAGHPPAIGPFTAIPEGAHSPGFTLLDNLYLWNGTFYVITSDVSKFPPVADMISVPRELAENVDLSPTAQEMQFLSASDVESTLGKHAIRVEGLSVVVYDPPQFLTVRTSYSSDDNTPVIPHLYHWWGEIILGAWRILSYEGAKTKEVLTPRRFLLPFSVKGAFRDNAGVNGPLMRAAWPSAQIEESDYWGDMIALNATVLFERVMLISRPAAHRHPWGNRWFKMIAGTMNVTVPDSFWSPIRDTLVTNLLGYLPTPAPTREPKMVHGVPEPLPKPLVTYVSRQGANTRRLLAKDHETLLSAFSDLEAQGVCEFREARMEELSLREQVELAARSTHELWMPPSHRSAVFEIFSPEAFLFDYELLARNIGHRHTAVWNDRLITYPKGTYHDGIKYGEHFHGTSIPVDAAILMKAVKERLAEKAP
ncbi:hypothetical protein DXG01_008242 [Tephrocybe rancida]|nr:hypothetical protein DXG01_008242 [Tephrocybe rancida]